jgi:hypothetical protein
MHDGALYKGFAGSVAIFPSLMALLLSLVYSGARVGFATNIIDVLRVTDLRLLILNVATLGRKRWFTTGQPTHKFLTADPKHGTGTTTLQLERPLRSRTSRASPVP